MERPKGGVLHYATLSAYSRPAGGYGSDAGGALREATDAQDDLHKLRAGQAYCPAGFCFDYCRLLRCQHRLHRRADTVQAQYVPRGALRGRAASAGAVPQAVRAQQGQGRPVR